MPPNGSFESQSFNPFSVNEDLKDNDQDPNVNFYQTQISSLDTSYYIPNEVKEKLENFQQKSFSVLHLNIRSMSKSFESFRELLDLCFTVCLPETWCQPHKTSNSNLQIPGYLSLHQTRKNRRGGGLFIFLPESLSYKVRDDLAINSSAIKCLCIEVFNKNSKSIVLNVAYRPPNGEPNELQNHFKNILSKQEITNKELVLVGDFNIDLLDFNESKMVQHFVNLMFRHGFISTINKPTRVTRNTATAIDHNITNSVKNTEFKTVIIKTDISDHFPMFFLFTCVVNTEAREEFIYKRNYSSNSIETFKQKQREVNWNEVKQSKNTNESYAKFSEICTSLYEECFPKFKIRLNQ